MVVLVRVCLPESLGSKSPQSGIPHKMSFAFRRNVIRKGCLVLFLLLVVF